MRLVLAGFGVVGQSFAELISLKEKELLQVYGMRPRLVAVIDRSGAAISEKGLDLPLLIRAKRRDGHVGARTEKSTAETIRDVEADVLVEATTTNFRTGEPGLSHMRAAFVSRKHVVTCNKGPLGVAFQALQELAKHNLVQMRYSGAVGGGTPILDFGMSCARGDDIVRVDAILNGTSNYILTQMEEEGLDFQSALRRAQEKGYAEADPSLDIDGYDTAVKLVIIANHLLLRKSTVGDVKVQGIREVSSDDISASKRRGRAIRLVATADGELTVGRTELGRHDPLCVSGPLNAVRFECRYSGTKVIVGKGAGGAETASSLLRDLIEVRRVVDLVGER